jgi:translation initiation factor 1
MARPAPKRPAGRVVYSSELGRLCSTCGKPVAKCSCAGAKARSSERPPTDGTVRVRRETKGRGGKVATVINGLPGELDALQTLAKRLKAKCGVGGSVKDWEIVIQGDKVDVVMAELTALGHRVKRQGG